MADRRIVDELSVDELEQILLIKRREARHGRLRQLAAEGRLADQSPLLAEEPPPSHAPKSPSSAGGRFQSPNLRPLSDTPPAEAPRVAPPRRKRRRLRDRLLLGLEVLALVGLVVVLDSSYDTLRMLNSEVAVAHEAQVVTEAAVTPTPLITQGTSSVGLWTPGTVSVGGSFSGSTSMVDRAGRLLSMPSLTVMSINRLPSLGASMSLCRY